MPLNLEKLIMDDVILQAMTCGAETWTTTNKYKGQTSSSSKKHGKSNLENTKL